jgi:hypothetical protein
MASLKEIRARLAAQESKGSNQGFTGESVIYPHWNIKEGETATVRFLPDADPDNPYFWIERQVIKLPFAGIKGGENKNVIVQVPCVEMWGETCPILSEVRPWFKDKSLEEMGRKYWKKRSYLFQGFVRNNPLGEEDKAPDNPIRRFTISPQIFNIIKASLMDPDMEELPTDYDQGLDFRIAKTSKGDYADYSTSNWARKETALDNAERDAIDEHGLFDLKEFLPNKPSEVELKVMVEMFEASVDGKAYDPDKWGQYFRPMGMSFDNDKKDEPKSESKPAPKAEPKVEAKEDDSVPFDVDESATKVEEPKEESAGSSSKAEDILAMIRSRQS